MAAPSAQPPLDYDVVIPSHARNLDLLLQAIASVRAQSLPARRIIVVVDANPNGATSLREAAPEVDVVLLPQRSGASGARQAGIEASSAEWVAFLDDDDLWAQDKQARTARYLSKHPDCRAVRAGYWMFTSADNQLLDGLNGQLVELRADTLDQLEEGSLTASPRNDLDYLDIQGDSLGLLLEFNRGVIGTSVVRRDVLLSIPAVGANQRPGDDHLLFIHVAAVTEWHLLKERLAYYRLHAAQDTRRRAPAGARGALLAKLRGWESYEALAPRPLSSYGAFYRIEIRRALWSLLRNGHPAEALRTYLFALPLLPKVSDRVLTLIPEPIVWRWHRTTSRAHHAPTNAGSPQW